jgi:hypothetical protein
MNDSINPADRLASYFLVLGWISTNHQVDYLHFFQQEASIKGEGETPKVASDSLENDSSDSEVISNFVHQKKATM